MLSASQEWAVVGLTCDLIGVCILGIDLLRVQRGLRNSSSKSRKAIHQLDDEYGGVNSWVVEISKKSDWREHDDMEGLSYPINQTFDPYAAQDAFKEAMDAVSAINQRLDEFALLVRAQVADGEELASMSFGYSCFGLALIIAGFLLQIYAVIGFM